MIIFPVSLICIRSTSKAMASSLKQGTAVLVNKSQKAVTNLNDTVWFSYENEKPMTLCFRVMLKMFDMLSSVLSIHKYELKHRMQKRRVSNVGVG